MVSIDAGTFHYITKCYNGDLSRRTDRAAVLKEAWIGDAVLSLYARLKILREDGAIDGAKSVRLTSNQFLSCLGEPSEVEADIGQVYASQGLDAAFGYIESRLIPVFERQEARRRK